MDLPLLQVQRTRPSSWHCAFPSLDPYSFWLVVLGQLRPHTKKKWHEFVHKDLKKDKSIVYYAMQKEMLWEITDTSDFNGFRRIEKTSCIRYTVNPFSHGFWLFHISGSIGPSHVPSGFESCCIFCIFMRCPWPLRRWMNSCEQTWPWSQMPQSSMPLVPLQGDSQMKLFNNQQTLSSMS